MAHTTTRPLKTMHIAYRPVPLHCMQRKGEGGREGGRGEGEMWGSGLREIRFEIIKESCLRLGEGRIEIWSEKLARNLKEKLGF